MSVCSRVSSTVVEPENMETFPGVSAAPVSVTSAERMLTSEGGVSVAARTTVEFPDWFCEPMPLELARQPANAAQAQTADMAKIERNRNIVPQLPSPKDSEAEWPPTSPIKASI